MKYTSRFGRWNIVALAATPRFLCELGPPPYAITDANQDELSGRWLEALKIRGGVQDIWAQLELEVN